MQTIVVLHSLVRWFIVVFGLWTLVNAITGVVTKRSFTPGDNRSNLLFMIGCDIQLVLGLILYFGGPYFNMLKNASNLMQDNFSRFFIMEHESMMLFAWILVHVGRSAVKKATSDNAKHKKMLIFFGLAIIIIIVAIPWPFRQNIGMPWFRWFSAA